MEEKTLTERVKRLEDLYLVDKIGAHPATVASAEELEKRYYASQSTEQVRDEKIRVGAEREYQEHRNRTASAALGAQAGPWGSYRDIDDQVRTQTSLEEIMQRVQHCTDRVIGTAHRLEVIGTRVFGPLPETDNGEGLAKVNPDGTLDHTLLALNWLDGAIRRLEIAEARLSGI